MSPTRNPARSFVPLLFFFSHCVVFAGPPAVGQASPFDGASPENLRPRTFSAAILYPLARANARFCSVSSRAACPDALDGNGSGPSLLRQRPYKPTVTSPKRAPRVCARLFMYVHVYFLTLKKKKKQSSPWPCVRPPGREASSAPRTRDADAPLPPFFVAAAGFFSQAHPERPQLFVRRPFFGIEKSSDCVTNGEETNDESSAFSFGREREGEARARAGRRRP
jgi:hypothetical protein